jgi:hypothetical protein
MIIKKYITAIAVLICLVECKADVAVSGTGLTLVAGYSRYRFTAWLNGEPVASSYAQSTTVLYGFPLQKGSNHVTVKMEILPPPARPPIGLKFMILVRDKPAEKAEWTEVEDYDEDGPFSNSPYVLESEFELKSSVGQTSKDFDSIRGDKESFEHRAQQLALEFAAKLRDGNEVEWDRIWGPSGGKAFWECRSRVHNTNEFTLKPISRTSEMAVESGNYLMVVHAKNGLLVEFLVNGKAQENGYADLLLARSRGKWYILGTNRHWWKLPDDFQRF